LNIISDIKPEDLIKRKFESDFNWGCKLKIAKAIINAPIHILFDKSLEINEYPGLIERIYNKIILGVSYGSSVDYFLQLVLQISDLEILLE